MVPVGIESITYLGEEEVCDIETEKHHTLFANGVAVHNCQDFDADLETEVMQVQAASPYQVKIFAGTSLTTETFLEGKFQQSSQGYWSLRCGCGHWNIPLPELKVMDMVQRQGPSCVKCGKLLNVFRGEFIHADTKMLAEKQWGFHVPQIILPAVVKMPLRWESIYKQKLQGNHNKFLQELLGIPTEEGVREITRKHLEDICILGDPRPLQERARNKGYDFIVSGCDWGGSDYNASEKLKVSTTVHVVMGIDAHHKFDILHMRRYMGMDYDDISDDIVGNHLALGGDAIGTDFGVGAVYNNRIRKHISPDKHLIFMYVGPRSPYIDEPEQSHLYNMWSLNKTETLTVLYDAIKAVRIRCYHWELAQEFLLDFMNMYRAPADLPGGATTFTYRASALKPNDTAQAINYAFIVGKILLREPIFADNTLRNKLEIILRGGGGGPSGFLPGRMMPRAISR